MRPTATSACPVSAPPHCGHPTQHPGHILKVLCCTAYLRCPGWPACAACRLQQLSGLMAAAPPSSSLPAAGADYARLQLLASRRRSELLVEHAHAQLLGLVQELSRGRPRVSACS